MSKNRSELKAGLFIVVSAALVLAAIVAIKGLGTWFEPKQVRTVSFALADDVGGLRIGDDVRIGGYRVGAVRSIKISDPLEGGHRRILVRFDLPRKYEIRDGASLGIQTGLTGSANLNIASLGTGDPLPDDSVLLGQPDFKTTLANRLGDIAPRVQSIAKQLDESTVPKVDAAVTEARDMLADVKGRVPGVVDKYNAVATEATRTFKNAGDLIGEGNTDFKTTLSNLSGITGDVKAKAPGILDKLDGAVAKVDGVLGDVKQALEDVKAGAASAKDALAGANGVINGNRAKLDGIIGSLKSTSDNLKNASAEIRRSPWRLLYKPAPNEMGNLNLYDAARQFAEGANDLNDAAGALRDAVSTPGTDEATVRKLVDRLDESFGKFQTVEADLWKRVKE